MKKSIYPIALLIVLCSCQKEISGDFLNTSTPSDLTGTWNFLNTHVDVSSTVEVNDGNSDVRSITVSDYVTQNNKGSLLFSDTLMITSGVSYDISTTANSYTYQDGNLVDSTDFPFSFSLPSTSYSNGFKRIGTDSIYVPNGSFTQVAGATGMSASPGGYRYRIISDTLVLTAILDQTVTDTTLGFPVKTNTKGIVTSTLKKQ